MSVEIKIQIIKYLYLILAPMDQMQLLMLRCILHDRYVRHNTQSKYLKHTFFVFNVLLTVHRDISVQ
jgi:hypothetical protein